MEKKPIDEKMHLEKEWFAKAANEIHTPEDLTNFAKELFENYQHDYGTVCHAVSALALAGAWLGTKIEGITSFQAGFVMWDFIKEWKFSNNECGLRIINYDDMLYPQYEGKFTSKTINPWQWNKLQELAKKKLEEELGVVESVRAHWQSIVDGKVPFGYIVKED